jgi:hypothetical protein
MSFQRFHEFSSKEIGQSFLEAQADCQFFFNMVVIFGYVNLGIDF